MNTADLDESVVVLCTQSGNIRYAPPATLECARESDGTDHAALYVGTFLGAVSTLVSGLVLAGVVPKILLLVSCTWGALSVAACVYALRSRRRYGRYVLRFDEGIIECQRGSRKRVVPMREIERFSTRRAPGVGSERLLLVRLRSGRELFLASAEPSRLRRVLTLLEDFGAEVARDD